jgi:hypothetical protein
MSGSTPAPGHNAAIGIDHVGIVGADLDALATAFAGIGFHLTPIATHGGGRIANHCAMLRDGGYLELMAVAPGMSSATLDRFLARGPGAHILALEVANEAAALERLHRAGIDAEVSLTGRDAGQDGASARFALIMPPDQPEGRMLLIRQLTRELLWRPDTLVHPNRAVELTEVVYATGTPAETMSWLSRLAGRPAEPIPLGGYRIPLARGCIRILPRAAAESLFPGAADVPALIGVTVMVESPKGAACGIAGDSAQTANRRKSGHPVPTGGDAGGQVVVAGGLAIRFIAAPA